MYCSFQFLNLAPLQINFLCIVTVVSNVYKSITLEPYFCLKVATMYPPDCWQNWEQMLWKLFGFQ